MLEDKCENRLGVELDTVEVAAHIVGVALSSDCNKGLEHVTGDMHCELSQPSLVLYFFGTWMTSLEDNVIVLPPNGTS